MSVSNGKSALGIGYACTVLLHLTLHIRPSSDCVKSLPKPKRSFYNTPSPLVEPAVYDALLDGYCAYANAVLSFPTRVLESIKAGKRLPEARFANLKIAAKGQQSVLSAFSKNKPPA